MQRRLYERCPTITLSLVALLLMGVLDFTAGFLFIDQQAIKRKAPRVPHWYFHHSLSENFSGVDYWGNKAYSLQTNHLGFKGPANKVTLHQSDRKRILFLGDSFTEGIGVPYAESFVGLLSRQYPEFEILNAGVAGYSPKLYYLKLKYLLEEVGLQFDKLVVLTDLSDVLDEFRYLHFSPRPDQQKAKWWLQLKRFLNAHSLICNRILRIRSQALQPGPVVSAGLEVKEPITAADWLATNPTEGIRQWSIKPELYESWGKQGLALAVENMQLLYQLCRQQNIELVLAVYP
ncbi:MAG: hypothetical protein AAFO94_17345, partial [Bacteroidota bacterium]